MIFTSLIFFNTSVYLAIRSFRLQQALANALAREREREESLKQSAADLAANWRNEVPG